MVKIIFVISLITSMQFNAQLTNGLIVNYNLDGNATDSGINQLNGSLNGVTSTMDRNGQSNAANYFDGIDDYISLPISNLLKPQFPISIGFWINAVGNEATTLYCSDFVDYQYYGFWVGISALNKLHVNFGDGGTAGSSSRRSKTANQTLTPGVWHHVICTIRSYSDMDIFIDCQDAGGTYDGNGSTSIVYSNSASPVIFKSVANSLFSSVYMNGSLDDLMIWNRSLTNSEILSFCSTNTIEDDIHSNEKIKLYPNLTNDILKIEFGNSQIEKIEIFNDLGQLVLNKIENFEVIDISNLANGIYHVNINCINGEIQKEKVIKN